MSDYALESFVANFAGTLEFFWAPGPESPQIVANKIDTLSESYRDMLMPMVASRQILIDDIQEHFDQEKDPEGIPWPEWSPRYSKTKKPGTKLRRTETEELYQAVMDTTAYPIVGNDLYINTENFPEYWRIHNQGGDTGRGHKTKIPKRTFLGASEEAGIAMIDVFDDWVGAQLRINVGVSGVAQQFNGTKFGQRIGLRSYTRRTRTSPPGMSWTLPEISWSDDAILGQLGV